MPRAKTVEFEEKGGDTVVMEEQSVIWPELDDTPEHKAIAKQAKKFAKSKAKRDELLSTAKEEQDADEQKLLEMLHEAGIESFKHNGMKVNIIPRGEKVRVKLDDDENDDDE